MHILRKPIALLGLFISVIAPVFLPFLQVPIKGNWNLYQTDVSLFLITYALLALCVIAFFLRKVSFYRLCTKIYLGWCVLGFIAVFFKINNYFGMKLVDGLLSKTIHLQWGWFVFFLGALVLLISVKKVAVIASPEEIGK